MVMIFKTSFDYVETVDPINIYDSFKSGTNCDTWPYLSFRSPVSYFLSEGSSEFVCVHVCVCTCLILLLNFSLVCLIFKVNV